MVMLKILIEHSSYSVMVVDMETHIWCQLMEKYVEYIYLHGSSFYKLYIVTLNV